MLTQDADSSIDPAPVQAAASGEPASHLAGAELGPQVIRARIFSADGKLLGKAKLSTKLERGPKAVLERIERCIWYAADDCDLSLSRVRAVGLGVPGQVEHGSVRLSSTLGWRDLPVQRVLERRLSLPVAVANLHNLAGWAVATREFPDAPRPMVVVFPGAEIGGTVLRGEGWVSLEGVAAGRSTRSRWRAPAENILCALPASEFAAFRARDFRRAIRSGSAPAKAFVLRAAGLATEAAGVLCRRFGARTLVLAGGAIEEIREEVLQRARAKLPASVGCTVLVSRLGEGAGLVGAALLAAGDGPR